MIDTVSVFSTKRSRSMTPSSSPDAMEAASSLRPKLEIRDVLGKREKLLQEVGRMVRLGRLLRSRLKEPLAHQRDRMLELEEISDVSGNQSAVQSISAKLLEVTRLAEKLDARLCEAGARTRTLEPIADEISLKEQSLSMEKRSHTSQEDKPKEIVKPTPEGDRSAVEDSNAEEYVTATECSSTPVPRSRSESFLSSEYEDALVSTTCRKMENELTNKDELFPVAKSETVVSTNPNDQEIIAECSPDEATVIQRIIQEKGGKIVKEVTETTTLRVSQDTRMGVASYKFVANTLSERDESTDVREHQELNRTLVNGETAPSSALQTSREEHTYASANGTVQNYQKASTMTTSQDEIRCYKEELLAVGRSVSEDVEHEERKESSPVLEAVSPEPIGR
ncbi:PREDICTED: uncharacterized protein LOC105360796 [Ceratosolen solmsi marchali]|uniref:Uncharacterized protein LOC105360796 n=1 Tax=Ceratosolen solmsi marchali TaxID=326594 RepID=A0AAJ6YDK1_9HYME|nr:PREDICTED: uncharacterized protein LOC105360796 [Ceratosolen solmsi marchali]